MTHTSMSEPSCASPRAREPEERDAAHARAETRPDARAETRRRLLARARRASRRRGYRVGNGRESSPSLTRRSVAAREDVRDAREDRNRRDDDPGAIVPAPTRREGGSGGTEGSAIARRGGGGVEAAGGDGSATATLRGVGCLGASRTGWVFRPSTWICAESAIRSSAGSSASSRPPADAHSASFSSPTPSRVRAGGR